MLVHRITGIAGTRTARLAQLAIVQKGELMRSTLLRLALFALLLSSPLMSEQVPFDCVQEIFIPEYSALSRNAGSQGTVVAEVSFDGALSSKMRVSGATPDLRASVEAALASLQLRPSCTVGGTFTLEFRFLLEAQRTSLGKPRASFSPPNSFTIRASASPLTQMSREK